MMNGFIAATGAYLLLSTTVVTAQTIDERVRSVEERLAEIEDTSDDPNTFRVYWNNGLRLDTADKNFRLKIGGRIHLDVLSPLSGDSDRDPNVDLDEGLRVGFRRARFAMSGDIYRVLGYKLQFDFAGGDADFADAFLELKKVLGPVKVRVGQFKEPFSLEWQTSANYIVFLERSLAYGLSPGRSTGAMLHGTAADDLITWAGGVFFASDSYGDRTRPPGVGSEFSFTGRVTMSPVYADKGRTVVHVGLAGSHRNPNDDMIRYRSRPEQWTTNRFLDTGTLGAEGVTLLGAEAAIVLGPFAAQAEYTTALIDTDNGGISDPEFRGWYVQSSVFLTGEHRRYDRKKGAFGRPMPAANLGDGNGFGAVEVAARVSNLRFDEMAVVAANANTMDAVTVGLNWYLNPNTRVMLDWTYADRSGIDPYQFIGARFQVDF